MPTLVFFWRPPSPFGQWTDSPFDIGGMVYGCAEQYIMAEKTRLFGDAATERRILETDDPRKQKKLGRHVVGFGWAFLAVLIGLWLYHLATLPDGRA